MPDDPYTLDQLRAPRMNVLIVRPLVDRLYDPDDISVGKKGLPFRLRTLFAQSFDKLARCAAFTESTMIASHYLA
jgi:hypothetical protein